MCVCVRGGGSLALFVASLKPVACFHSKVLQGVAVPHRRGPRAAQNWAPSPPHPSLRGAAAHLRRGSRAPTWPRAAAPGRRPGRAGSSPPPGRWRPAAAARRPGRGRGGGGGTRNGAPLLLRRRRRCRCWPWGRAANHASGSCRLVVRARIASQAASGERSGAATAASASLAAQSLWAPPRSFAAAATRPALIGSPQTFPASHWLRAGARQAGRQAGRPGGAGNSTRRRPLSGNGLMSHGGYSELRSRG